MISSPKSAVIQFPTASLEKSSEQNTRNRIENALTDKNRLTHEQRMAARNLPWFSHQQKELDRLNGEKFDLFVEKLSQIFGKKMDWLPNVKLSSGRWLDIPEGPFLKALRAATQPPKTAPRVSGPKHRSAFRKAPKAIKVEIIAVREATSKKGNDGYLVTEKIGKQK